MFYTFQHVFQAAQSTYYNMVYNLRFDEFPLEEEKKMVRTEVIREMEPFTIQLPENNDIEESFIALKLKEKTGIVDIQLKHSSKSKFFEV